MLTSPLAGSEKQNQMIMVRLMLMLMMVTHTSIELIFLKVNPPPTLILSVIWEIVIDFGAQVFHEIGGPVRNLRG